MAKYIMRLDDACHRMNIDKWSRMESILDKYGVRPLVGVVPKIEDEEMMEYDYNPDFWNIVDRWKSKDWSIALHGYEHDCKSKNGGLHPVNNRSEFAGVSLEEQKRKIKAGYEILKENKVAPVAFFAPAHTFDENTIEALKTETDIRIVSDTISNKPYCKYGVTFVPQQTGRVRSLPLDTVTFCYHPNKMCDDDFKKMETFIQKHYKSFVAFPAKPSSNKESLFDKILRKVYFLRRK